jgi:mRNA-degrading endonuclease RelE of RelBE toxin-antitoxin system
VLDEMTTDPFSGDVPPLKNQSSAFRRRVGNWRIFFDVSHDQRLVEVTSIERHTTTTYRKR